MAARSQDTVLKGIFADRYKIERCLGRGGMGSVYLVRDKLLADEPLALKIIHREYARDAAYRRRFKSEIRISRRITHPNIVRTFDVGYSDRRLFFTMEYVAGKTLEEQLASRPIKVERVIYLLDEIARGLEAIHDAGVVHRDLKAGNIIISKTGTAKITDFGIAGARGINSDNALIASTGYLAPEAWTDDATPLSDIYALGVVAFEMLTGVLPFDGELPAEMMRQHQEVMPARPGTSRSGVPEWLDQLVLQMLAKDPGERPCSASAVRTLIADNMSRTTIDYCQALQIALEVSDLACDSNPDDQKRWTNSHRRLEGARTVGRLIKPAEKKGGRPGRAQKSKRSA